MYARLFSLLCGLALVLGGSLAFAVDAAITVPTLGVDWAATVTALTTAITTIVVACLGLWAGLKLIRAAKRFIGGAVMGR